VDLDEETKAASGSSTPALQDKKKVKQKKTAEEIQQMRQRAHEQLDTRHWSQAGEMFLELLDYNANDEDALLGVAVTLDAVGRYESLYTMAQTILDRNPGSASALAYKARALQKLERLSEATIANDQALLLDTNLPLAWINRSGLQLLQQKLPEALRSALRATELAPRDARAWANKGVALANFNHLLEALTAFDLSLSIDPENIFSLQMKSDILCKLGRMREAIPVIRQALLIHPENVAIMTQGIHALRALEQYSALKEMARELIKLTPDSLFAWENCMRGLRGMGQYEESLPAIDRVIELDPANVRFWTIKADTLYRLERYREAAKIAERAVRLHTDYSPARRIREKSVRAMYQKKDKKKS